jgi:hypothetical protein
MFKANFPKWWKFFIKFFIGYYISNILYIVFLNFSYFSLILSLSCLFIWLVNYQMWISTTEYKMKTLRYLYNNLTWLNYKPIFFYYIYMYLITICKFIENKINELRTY